MWQRAFGVAIHDLRDRRLAILQQALVCCVSTTNGFSATQSSQISQGTGTYSPQRIPKPHTVRNTFLSCSTQLTQPLSAAYSTAAGASHDGQDRLQTATAPAWSEQLVSTWRSIVRLPVTRQSLRDSWGQQERGFASDQSRAARVRQAQERARRIARQQAAQQAQQAAQEPVSYDAQAQQAQQGAQPSDLQQQQHLEQAPFAQLRPGEPERQVQAAETPASALQMADVVRHPALIIARNIEWGTVIFGFEQANKYTIYDQDGNVVALLAEDLGGFGRAVGRQALRTRRPLTATVFSPDGSQVIFRVRRPFYLINSTIFVEDGAGNVIGEVKQRWHLWQRNYDLYRAKRQFAYVNGSFLAWEFVLRDEQGGVLALIDRNFQGFGKEIFTDAGKYVIHFGDRAKQAAEQVANTIAAAHPDKPRPPVTALAKFREDIVVVPTQSGDQLEVARPLEIDERSMALAAAISIDYDYFSQHSHGGGWLNPIFMPMPVPSYPPAEPPEGAAGAEVPPEAAPGTPSPAGEAGAPDAPPGSFGQEPGGFGQQPLERELGSDEGFQPPPEDSGWDKQGGEGFEGEELGEWGGGGDSGGGDGGGLWDVAKQLLGIED